MFWKQSAPLLLGSVITSVDKPEALSASSSISVPRYALAIALLVIFSVSMWATARAGFASLLYSYAERTNQLAAADAAVNLSPADPEAHFVRGAVLEVSNDLPGAIAEYKQAASLRPQDYVLWLSLARAHELNGEVPEAIAAARQAVPLAPYYAQPRWQLGNLLVRAGQRDEGFSELRLAGVGDPSLLPGIIDLAWQLSGGDVPFVMRAIAPQSRESYKALAEYLKNRGKTTQAIAMYSAAGSDAESQRQQYLTELVSTKRFKEAYALWLTAHPGSSGDGIGVVINPGFEEESNLDEPGFGWRTANKAPSISLSLAAANPGAGHSSLQVGLKGESDPGQPIISQLVLVSPNTHYQLHFAARTENIVSGGLPRVSVLDANNNQALGATVGLPQQTSSWQNYTIDFNSKDTTNAILISLQRDGCSKSPCPIFGRLWLDEFSLQRL